MENSTSNVSNFASGFSETELVAMLNSMRDLFPEEVIHAFLLELERRNLPAEQLIKLKQETENNRLTAPLPLGIFWKLIAFLIPFITIIFPSILRAFGYQRKARQLKTWSMYGFLTYTILVVLVGLLSI